MTPDVADIGRVALALVKLPGGATAREIIGEFEGNDMDDAIKQAFHSDAFQDNTGSLCHYYTKKCGDEGDIELIAEGKEDVP